MKIGEHLMNKEVKQINIGIIGCGHISQSHIFSLTLIQANARIIWQWKENEVKIKPNIYALADVNPQAVKQIAEKFPVKKIYSGENAGYQLLEDPEVNAVFILTPTFFHKEFVLKALNKGIHVFGEKPLAFSLEDIDEMIQARDRNNVVLQVGLIMRSASPIHYLKHLAEENSEKWGRPMNIVMRDSQEKPYKGAEEVHNSVWRKDQSLAHAGILFEHSIHDIDAMIYMFGNINEVYAKTKNYAGHPGIEDSVSAILSFETGINLSITAMWNDLVYDCRLYEIYFERARLKITVDGRSKKLLEIFLLYLDEPEVELDVEEMDKFFFEKLGFPHVKSEVTGPQYIEDFRFIDAIVNHNIQSNISAETGRYAQQIIEACYESSRKGLPIKIQNRKSN